MKNKIILNNSNMNIVFFLPYILKKKTQSIFIYLIIYLK